MKCENGKCTRVATTNNLQYHSNKWLCTFHSNKLIVEGRIKRKNEKRNSKNNRTKDINRNS